MSEVVGAADLAAAAAGGDRTAFETLIRPLLRPAYALAFAMLRDRGAAEDAVQEAAVDAWRRIGQLRGGDAAMRAWFLKIVANRGRASMRQSWWRVVKGAGDADRQAVAGPGREEAVDLQRAMARLRPQERAVLYLHYCEDMTVEDVARSLGLRPAAARSRIHRAAARLRRMLGPAVEGS